MLIFFSDNGKNTVLTLSILCYASKKLDLQVAFDSNVILSYDLQKDLQIVGQLYLLLYVSMHSMMFQREMSGKGGKDAKGGKDIDPSALYR